LLEEVLEGSTTRRGKRLSALQLSYITKLRSGFISFNHFVRVGDIENLDWPRLLIWAWERHAAIICPAGFPGIDLVIPIWYSTAADGLTAVGALMIQVKNTLAKFPSANVLHGCEAIGFGDDKEAIFLGLFIGMRMQHATVQRDKGARLDDAETRWTSCALGSKVVTPALIAGDLACVDSLSHEAVNELSKLCDLHRFKPGFSDRRYKLVKASYCAVPVPTQSGGTVEKRKQGASSDSSSGDERDRQGRSKASRVEKKHKGEETATGASGRDRGGRGGLGGRRRGEGQRGRGGRANHRMVGRK